MYIFWIGIVLMGLIIGRAIRGKLLLKYPLFYLYLSYVFIQSVICFAVFYWSKSNYARVYWTTESVAVILGCGVIWEIYTQTLALYAGAAKLAKAALLVAMLIAVTRILIQPRANRGTLFAGEITAELDRNMREIQAVFLSLILALLLYYSIPLGRNLKGMIAGYTLYIGALIFGLAFRTYLRVEFQLAPVAYTSTLGIWCSSLWFYSPNPPPEPGSKVLSDYEAISEMSLKTISRAKRYLSRGERS